MKETIVGLKDLRENMTSYIKKIRHGESFIVFKKSRPIFKITAPEEDSQWERIINFSEIKKGGISIDDLLKNL